MASYKGTVDFVMVQAKRNKPGTAYEKIQLSNLLNADTEEPTEGGPVATFVLWDDLQDEPETSAVMLRRSMWVSMAQTGLRNRDSLDLIVDTASDTDIRVTSVRLAAKERCKELPGAVSCRARESLPRLVQQGE